MACGPNRLKSTVVCATLLCVSVMLGTSYASTGDLREVLMTTDKDLDELTERIRGDTIGWFDIEIVSSTRTEGYMKDYVVLQNKLSPIITAAAHTVRARVDALRTMGDIQTNMPRLLADAMTIDTYQGKLNHIEFLLLSRHSTIASRQSIWIALFFGTSSVLATVVSFIRGRRKQREEVVPTTPAIAAAPSAAADMCNADSDDGEPNHEDP
jgi:hypothetical protein